MEEIPCSTKGTVPWRSVAYSDLGRRDEAAGYRIDSCCINHHDNIFGPSHKIYMTNHWYSVEEEAYVLPRSDISSLKHVSNTNLTPRLGSTVTRTNSAFGSYPRPCTVHLSTNRSSSSSTRSSIPTTKTSHRPCPNSSPTSSASLPKLPLQLSPPPNRLLLIGPHRLQHHRSRRQVTPRRHKGPHPGPAATLQRRGLRP